MLDKNVEKVDDFEWDRKRILGFLFILSIVLSIGWTFYNFYKPPVYVENVTYVLDVDRDQNRFNSVYQTLFGGSPDYDNVTLVVARLLIGEIPDVNRITISMTTTSPTHLVAILLTEWQNENNVLHGVNNIPAEQDSYALNVNGINQNLILYMFFENTTSGGFDLNIRAFRSG